MRFSFILVAGLGLAACDENGEFAMPSFGGDDSETAQGTAPSLSAPSAGLVERDVEAPEVFSVSETGLWDGRPSLGGVWVAHPDVTDPERVIIRNQANQQFVIGALFRRERENPGPSLQVSSDAAEALGMLAGAPTQLEVVALRREEGPAEVASTAITNFDAPEQIVATPLDEDAAPTASGDIADAAAAAIAAASAASAAQTTAPAAAPIPAPAPAPVAAPTSTLEKPFIQIGIFSVEANANNTADLLRNDGLSARVLSQQSQGRAFWRVVVGPSPNADDRAAVLAKVKALGFSDAYFVTN
ncbi:SPOR domain-containing protein [Cognatiyoonia koreensis]|nr:SPOR domain-containing protein [Cognatiyoonia koreensis]